MRFISYPILSNLFYFNIKKSFPEAKGKLFLTFDDGPDPSITPQILEILKNYKCRATFFCLGSQIKKHPDLFFQIIKNGHAIGNHGYEHLDGWKLKLEDFISNVVTGFEMTQSKLFRPPYGKLKPNQYFYLKNKFQIIAWDVMSYDFDLNLTVEECAEIVIKHAKDGSVIVLHDNLKSGKKVQNILPKIIEHFQAKGCLFTALDAVI